MIIPVLQKSEVKQRFIEAQRLNQVAPFGEGVAATRLAIEHLGYVQIDTISVIERCHHHILFNRIPSYQKSDLHHAQSIQKSVFEYWTHALAYVPACDYRFFLRDMKSYQQEPGNWFQSVKKTELQKVLKLIQKEGALSIRDIEDDELVEKDHPWASKKPSKKALQLAFFMGKLAVSERVGMSKKYELTERHFGWQKKPALPSMSEVHEYRLTRALRTQGVVSLDSICYLEPKLKPFLKKLIVSKVKKGLLREVTVQGMEKIQHWIQTHELEEPPCQELSLTHLLSPFDPLVIQRKRLENLFTYTHRFEAYLPKEKRVMGYFALPVLMENEFVAAIDLKADRAKKKLIIQQWTWIGKHQSSARKKEIETALHQFEQFQFR